MPFVKGLLYTQCKLTLYIEAYKKYDEISELPGSYVYIGNICKHNSKVSTTFRPIAFI